MFAVMDAFIWSTKAPRARYCTTLHVVSVPRGVLADDIELVIFKRHSIDSTVTTVITGRRICAFIKVRGFEDALRLLENGGMLVKNSWVSMEKCKNVRRWTLQNSLEIRGLPMGTLDEDIRVK